MFVGRRLLFASLSLRAVGCWLLVVGCGLLFDVSCVSFVACYLLLVFVVVGAVCVMFRYGLVVVCRLRLVVLLVVALCSLFVYRLWPPAVVANLPLLRCRCFSPSAFCIICLFVCVLVCVCCLSPVVCCVLPVCC